jgi:hypothetical protein
MNPSDHIKIVNFAAGGDISSVKQSLLSGIPANACDDFGRTALHEAAARNNTELLELLIQNGADPNSACADGWTPLCEAARNNCVEAFKKLLEHGSRVDLPCPWSVYDAAIRGNAGLDLFNLLLPKLSPDTLDNKGRPIIDEAIRRKRPDVVSALIHLGANMSHSMESMAATVHKKGIERIIAIEKRVLVDLDYSREPLNAILTVGWDMEKLWEGGPVGPVRQFVELNQGENLFFRWETPTRRGIEYPYQNILLDMREKIWEAGYYPRLAIFHPKLEITGLSCGYGGYIGWGKYCYLSYVITHPGSITQLLS